MVNSRSSRIRLIAWASARKYGSPSSGPLAQSLPRAAHRLAQEGDRHLAGVQQLGVAELAGLEDEGAVQHRAAAPRVSSAASICGCPPAARIRTSASGCRPTRLSASRAATSEIERRVLTAMTLPRSSLDLDLRLDEQYPFDLVRRWSR